MSVQQGTNFELEIFHRASGRLAAIVTLRGGADVAYICPDGTVQWTEYEDIFGANKNAVDEITAMSAYVVAQNKVA